MSADTPTEFTLTLSKDTVETVLLTLIGAAKVSTTHEAHSMLTAADEVRRQVSLSGFTFTIRSPEKKPKRKLFR